MRILILSYLFPPNNAIASLRPKSWTTEFPAHGIYPIIATRHWTGNELSFDEESSTKLNEIEHNIYSEYEIYKLPYNSIAFQYFNAVRKKSRLLGSLYIAYRVLTGQKDLYYDAMEFKLNLEIILSKTSVDAILVTLGPFNQLKLGSLLSKRFRLPLILDFRDMWDNRILNPNIHLSLKEKILFAIAKAQAKHYAKRAVLITAVTKGLHTHITKIIPRVPSSIIFNGYEKSLLSTFRKKSKPLERFTFSIVGTLYESQNFTVLIEGLQTFLIGKNLRSIKLQFIGADAIYEVGRLLRNSLPGECTIVSARLPRIEALRLMSESNVLGYVGWQGYKGIVSGKMYEYLALGKNILVAPGDHDELDELIAQTKTGKIADTPDEFAEIMNEWYAEWKQKGYLDYNGDTKKIAFYTRENQARIFAEEIKKVLRDESSK